MITRKEAVDMINEVRVILILIPNLSKREKLDAAKRLKEIRCKLIEYRRANPDATQP